MINWSIRIPWLGVWAGGVIPLKTHTFLLQYIVGYLYTYDSIKKKPYLCVYVSCNIKYVLR